MIPMSKAKLRIVKLVAAVRVNAPFVRAFGHDEEPCALLICVGQGSEPHRSELPGAANSWSAKTWPTVE